VRPGEPSLLERGLHAIRRHSRKNIDCARVEKTCDALIGSMALEKLPHEMPRGDAASPFRRVHVAVDDERRLFEWRTGRLIGQCQKPDRTARRSRADAFELDEIRLRVGPGVEEFRQIVVTEDVIEREGSRSAAMLAAGCDGILPARVGNSRDRPAESRRSEAAKRKHEKKWFHARSFAAFSRIGRMRLNSERNFSAAKAVKPKTRPGRT